MISAPAPFPFAGSYALHVDHALPVIDQRAELVRITRVDGIHCTVTFPLRTGSSGIRTVMEMDLLDGTPLTQAEQVELADALREVKGRKRLSSRLKALADRAEDLRARAMAAIILESELAKLRARGDRDLRRHGGSTGGRMATAA